MLISDAMLIDRIRNKINSEWNVDLVSLETNGRVTLSTFHDWYMPDGMLDLQKNITRLTKKIKQSLEQGRKGFRRVGDMNPLFSFDMIQEALNFERLWQKKFDLPLIGICAYTRQHIEQLEDAAIELTHQHHGRVIGCHD
jgi:hypothetical protein